MIRRKSIYSLIIFTFFSLSFLKAFSQEVVDTIKNRSIFEAYIEEMSSFSNESLSFLNVRTAKYFLGKPYVASTLEKNKKEKLVVNFEEFDCTTFVETCLALSLTLKSEQQTYENYCKNLTNIRYRKGIIDGYTSRLHYVTEWIDNAESDSLLQNISITIGGKEYNKSLNFMSKHPQYYEKLKDDSSNLIKIKDIESAINKRGMYAFVPIGAIYRAKRYINDGDIIIFATSIDGLDYSHIGIAYKQNESLHFIHASSRAKKVIIESKTIEEYCQSSKKCTGISVLRLKERLHK